ncbi:ankyrin [Aspergillus bertholletiae]|uniref:Ankyrin n=1 Tax=Aspergillus bertholletiae TaxID=1226010 RepID=A0A5N7B955_9EURO|nr:ankyrin [Aspergillus bertholletiae]
MMDIYEAARQGSVNDIESAVEEGCDVNTPDENEKTPLWLAVKGGHVDACRILIARGARVEGQPSSVIDLAVQEGHIEIVKLLWPGLYCTVERQHRHLETAISLGFHEIADFLAGTQAFNYQHFQTSDLEMLKEDGFSRREVAAFQQWERFIFVRRYEELRLHQIFFDYALLLATKADRNTGLRLVNLLLRSDKPLADANCVIKIDGEIETPLTNAAMKGNLEILAILIEHPEIKLTMCGKYNWPAFLHLLACPDSIASEQGRAIARILSQGILPDSFLIDGKEAHLETVFRNVLRRGDDGLVKQVIDLVHGAGGLSILPLLIRANDPHGLRWILNNDIARACKPPPILWVLLCNFFQHNPTSEALSLFIRVAVFLIEKAIWDRMVLVCLNSRNFCFVKQFFYPLDELPPREVTEETLKGLSQLSIDQPLIRDWVGKGFANAALWSAVQFGIWKRPTFECLISCPDIDLDEPFPCTTSSNRGETNIILPPSPIPTGEKRKLPLAGRSLGIHELGTPQNHALQDYQMQLMLLDQQNKKRLMMARKEQTEMSAVKRLRAETAGKNPLAWAAANRNARLVEALLRSSRVNVNSQDAYKRTPLMHAIIANDRQIVEELLKIGYIDLNLQDNDGRTAVFHAIQRGELHIIQLLIRTGRVDLSIRDCNGETAQDIANKWGRPDVIAALAT